MRALLLLVLCSACAGHSVRYDERGEEGAPDSNGGSGNQGNAGAATGGGATGNGMRFPCGPQDLVELFEKYCITCTCDSNNVEICEQCDATCEVEEGAWLDVGSAQTMSDGCTVCSCTAYGLECNTSACSRPHPRIPV